MVHTRTLPAVRSWSLFLSFSVLHDMSSTGVSAKILSEREEESTIVKLNILRRNYSTVRSGQLMEAFKGFNVIGHHSRETRKFSCNNIYAVTSLYPGSVDRVAFFACFAGGGSEVLGVVTTTVWLISPYLESVMICSAGTVPPSNSSISTWGSTDAGSHVFFSCPTQAT